MVCRLDVRSNWAATCARFAEARSDAFDSSILSLRSHRGLVQEVRRLRRGVETDRT